MLRVVIEDGEGAEVLKEEADAVAIVMLRREELTPVGEIPIVSLNYQLEGFASVFEAVGALKFALGRMRDQMDDVEEEPGSNGNQEGAS